MEKITKSPLFQIERLSKDYGSRTVVDVSNIYINPGDFLILVGPSGAGKSTLLRLLNYLELPTIGEFVFDGEALEYPISIETQRKASMVFQRPEFLNRSVFENIEYPLWIRGIKDKEIIEKVLGMMHLERLKDEKAKSLSGGESQRLALARAIVTEPKVIFLDEPTANLDPYNVELIENIILDLHKMGKTIIMVTHNVFQAKRLAETVGLMLNGKIVEISSSNTFFNTPKDPRVRDFLEGRIIY